VLQGTPIVTKLRSQHPTQCGLPASMKSCRRPRRKRHLKPHAMASPSIHNADHPHGPRPTIDIYKALEDQRLNTNSRFTFNASQSPPPSPKPPPKPPPKSPPLLPPDKPTSDTSLIRTAIEAFPAVSVSVSSPSVC